MSPLRQVVIRCVEEYDAASREKRQSMIESWDFSVRGWLWVRGLTAHSHLKAIAVKNAFALAKDLDDYVVLAGLLDDEHRQRALKEILKFDISSDEDIALLQRSGSVRLSHVGWYLAERKKIKQAQ